MWGQTKLVTVSYAWCRWAGSDKAVKSSFRKLQACVFGVRVNSCGKEEGSTDG